MIVVEQSTNTQLTMKNIIKLLAVAAVAAALTQTAHAALMSGNIGFTGQLTGNSTEATNVTVVTGWINTEAQGPGGTFVPFVSNGQNATFAAPWNLNTTTAILNFWQVGGFTFSLATSSIISVSGGSLTDFITGTVAGNGFSATPYTGRLSFQDPNTGSGPMDFTISLSFQPVPDGASTVLLLGTALSGLALLKRKFTA